MLFRAFLPLVVQGMGRAPIDMAALRDPFQASTCDINRPAEIEWLKDG